MKKGCSKILLIIFVVLVVGLSGCLITWGVISYLGRRQTLTIKSIENPHGNLFVIHLSKPSNMSWEPGSYAEFSLPDIKKKGQKNRWLTIFSNSTENEIIVMTRNSGSLYKKTLISLPLGSNVEISWIRSHLSIEDDKKPIVCFASDVGIAAIRPIVKKWMNSRTIVFNHLNKGITYFEKEMVELSIQKSTFTFESSLSFYQSQESMKKVVKVYGNNAIYLLAGQPDDIEEMKIILEDEGINEKQIQVDDFKGLK